MVQGLTWPPGRTIFRIAPGSGVLVILKQAIDVLSGVFLEIPFGVTISLKRWPWS